MTRNLDAYAYPDEDAPNQYRVRGIDEHGRRMVGIAKYIDGQSEPPGEISSDLSPVTEQEAVEERAADNIVQDENTSLDDRINALQEWIFLDSDSAAAFILDELEKDDSSPEWRNALIYAAEDVRFPNEKDQVRLCNRLRELALVLRESSEPNIERVVWTALRRFASLVAEERANELTEFLYQRGQVDTRLVALQGIVHIFEIAPPQQLKDCQPLADRVFELSSKLIDPDVMTAGETSAIAEQGILALGTLGDHRLKTCLEKLDALRWQWLSQRVLEDLEELRNQWVGSEHDLASHSAFLQLCRVIEGREPAKYEQSAKSD